MAGSTDDVECFFGLLHHLTKDQNVMLKEFKYSRSFLMTSGGQEKLKESMKKCTTSTSCSPKALIDNQFLYVSLESTHTGDREKKKK